ncbi:HNH endonuclease [Candidatus Pacearchaeota archaeon]|nr:HNH endonuclease [Candidatus Pacearchaeota archaeon]
MLKRQAIPFKTKYEVFSRDKFRCQKCGHQGKSEELEVHPIKMKVNGGEDEEINLITLCSICHYYAPDDEKEFEIYLSEKIEGNILDTFRKSQKSISKRTKKGMDKRAQAGNVVTRAPYGYKLENKKLIPIEKSYLVQEIFQDFLNNKISLTQLSKKYGFSVNGLKKILTNQTYLGKIKFSGQIHQGNHQPLLSSTLFNHVQNKLEKLGIKFIS